MNASPISLRSCQVSRSSVRTMTVNCRTATSDGIYPSCQNGCYIISTNALHMVSG